MYRKRIFLILTILALASLACNFSVNLPVPKIKTGRTETKEIDVATLVDPSVVADVSLTFGGGDLNLAPGAEGALVSGTATYNVAEFEPEVTVDSNEVRITQGDVDFKGIPNLGGNIKNEWDLKLGKSPMELTIAAGGYKGEMELGGLALHALNVTDGAADAQLSFSEPNLAEMSSLVYKTGASQVTMTGLANANFSQMSFDGGAGNYTLDFSGQLQRDATVTIKAGLSNLEIVVPEGTSVSLTVEGGLSNVSAGGNWEGSSGEYHLAGEGPTLTIDVEMGAGNLRLRNL